MANTAFACAVCAAALLPRRPQHPNQDTGWGVCDQCVGGLLHLPGFNAISDAPVSLDDLKRTYGTPGEHYNLPPIPVRVINAIGTAKRHRRAHARMAYCDGYSAQEAPRLAELAAIVDELPAVLAALQDLAFITETVAHTRGLEAELLPCADTARALIAKLEG